MRKPVTIKGAERLMKSLTSLEKRGARRALRKAMNAGGTVLRKAVRDAVPVDEGLLKKAQDSKVVGKGLSLGIIIGANVGKLRADSAASNGQRPTNIDHLVEFGHTAPDGTVIPPRGYMRRAADTAMPAAEMRFINKLEEEITREAMKG